LIINILKIPNYASEVFGQTRQSKTLSLDILIIFEKQLPTLDYFVHLQCSKRTSSRNQEKNAIIKPTNN